MKRTALTLCLTLCIISSYAQSGRLIGSWRSADKSSIAEDIIVFKPDKTAMLNVEGRKLMIEEYIVDTSVEPMQVELKTHIDGQPVSLYLLVEFIQGNSMKMEIFPLGTINPAEFSEDTSDSQILLTRRP